MSESIISKRLSLLATVLMLLFAVLSLRFAYMKTLYNSEFAVQKQQTIAASSTSFIHDIEERFSLQLTGFHAVSADALIQQSKQDESVLSLLALANEICRSGCAQAPFIFLQDNQGYLLSQTSAATYVVWQLQKQKQEWIVREKSQAAK